MEEISIRGWLHENYRLFHNKDQRDMDFQSHYHEFHKIVVCLSGQVTYIIEGNTYHLTSGNILIIPEHQIHQSILQSGTPYERIILWINNNYLLSYKEPVLLHVFLWALEQHYGLFTPGASDCRVLLDLLFALERAQTSHPPAFELLAETYLLQFLIELDRQLCQATTPPESVSKDAETTRILSYITSNLSSDLSVNTLARLFYISPSHLMHSFKQHTGCSLHAYIQQKRLINAASRIQSGSSILDAAKASGFSDYSVFLKAFRKQYNCSPKELRYHQTSVSSANSSSLGKDSPSSTSIKGALKEDAKNSVPNTTGFNAKAAGTDANADVNSDVNSDVDSDADSITANTGSDFDSGKSSKPNTDTTTTTNSDTPSDTTADSTKDTTKDTTSVAGT